MTQNPVAIHWFRRDLRLADNPALIRAAAAGRVLPVFVDDPEFPNETTTGAAGRVWLHHSLAALDRALGGRLNFYRGRAQDVLTSLADRHGARLVSWTALPDPALHHRDEAIAEALKARGIETHRGTGYLLWEPWEIRKADGSPWKVFTPFFRKGCLAAPPPRMPIPRPVLKPVAEAQALPLAALGLLPGRPWADRVIGRWRVGEAAAQERLSDFVRADLAAYTQARDIPGRAATSRLSPYLHFGEISPNTAWHAARGPGADKFRAELGWREFSWNLMTHNPDLAHRPLRDEFARFPWREDAAAFTAWTMGRTGIPLVDAGMRELWQTGWMHNRVRMVVASFLVKNLLIDWRRGEAWFRDTLVDADPASNAASWQWVAGCGADAAPFFRIFNPVLQGEKFDPAGSYVRKFVPELAALADRWLHRPWQAPPPALAQAGVRLGETYPRPIVDLAASRSRALAAFAELRAVGSGPQNGAGLR